MVSSDIFIDESRRKDGCLKDYKVENIFSVKNKNAVITGASKGIGREFARLLAANGVNLSLVARNSKELHELKDALASFDVEVHIHSFDLTDFENIPRLIKDISSNFKSIDILINNAGINLAKPVEAVTLEDWDKQVDINLKSVFFLTKHIGELMKADRQGKIINISSQMSAVGYYDRSVYGTTKGGLTQMTKAFAIEWAEHNINVNAVAPTFIETNLTKKMFEDSSFKEEVLGRIPLNRLAEEQDLFGTILLLASPASDMITGQTIFVDGGWTVW